MNTTVLSPIEAESQTTVLIGSVWRGDAASA